MRLTRWFPLAITLCCLAVVYRLTAPPGLTWQHGGADGGELALVAQRLGVAHPPGYTLYALLGWAFIHLGGARPVVAMQWFSHVSALAACGLLTFTVFRLALRANLPSPRAAGLTAALALGLSRTFWSQAIIVEVYTLMTALFCALLFLSSAQRRTTSSGFNTEAQRRKETSKRFYSVLSPQSSVLFSKSFFSWRSWRFGGSICFLLGHLYALSLTHHLTTLLWLPGLVWLLGKIGLRGWLWFSTGAITGLWPLLLMLIRAGADPVANWGSVNASFDAFRAHLMGDIYRDLLPTPTLAGIAQGIGVWLASLPADFTWAGVGLIVGGIIAAVRARFYNLLIASVLWGGALAAFTGLYSADNTSDVYRLPLAALAALYIAFGGAWLLRRISPLRLAFPLLLAALLIVANRTAVDLSADHQVADYYRNAVETVPPHSVVVTSRDEETFALWYYIWAEGQTPDWVLVNDRLLRFEWYRASLARLYPTLAPIPDTIAAWIRTDALAGYTIASPGLVSPPPGRASGRANGWYLLPP